jgi:hypothetical protein
MSLPTSKQTLANLNSSATLNNNIELERQGVNDKTAQDRNINDENEVRKFLLTEEHFQLLKKIQQEIFTITDVSPGIRKLLNAVINEDRMNEIKNHFIDQFK